MLFVCFHPATGRGCFCLVVLAKSAQAARALLTVLFLTLAIEAALFLVVGFVTATILAAGYGYLAVGTLALLLLALGSERRRLVATAALPIADEAYFLFAVGIPVIPC